MPMKRLQIRDESVAQRATVFRYDSGFDRFPDFYFCSLGYPKYLESTSRTGHIAHQH